jgi:hypothetical protein
VSGIIQEFQTALLAHQDVDYIWGNVPPLIVLSCERTTQYNKEERWSGVFEEKAHKNTRLMLSIELSARKLRMSPAVIFFHVNE